MDAMIVRLIERAEQAPLPPPLVDDRETRQAWQLAVNFGGPRLPYTGGVRGWLRRRLMAEDDARLFNAFLNGVAAGIRFGREFLDTHPGWLEARKETIPELPDTEVRPEIPRDLFKDFEDYIAAHEFYGMGHVAGWIGTVLAWRADMAPK